MKRYSYWTTRDGVRKRSVSVVRPKTILKTVSRLVTYKRGKKTVSYWREVERLIERKLAPPLPPPPQPPPPTPPPPPPLPPPPPESGTVTWVELADFVLQLSIRRQIETVQFYFRGELVFSDKAARFLEYMNDLQKLLAFEYKTDGDFWDYWRIIPFPFAIENRNLIIEFE
jgi:hypothetical protein